MKHLTVTEARAFADKWLPAWSGNNPDLLASLYSDDAFYLDPAIPSGVRGKLALLAGRADQCAAADARGRTRLSAEVRRQEACRRTMDRNSGFVPRTSMKSTTLERIGHLLAILRGYSAHSEVRPTVFHLNGQIATLVENIRA